MIRLLLALLISAPLFAADMTPEQQAVYRANEQAEAVKAELHQKRALATAQADILIKAAFTLDLTSVNFSMSAKMCRQEVAKIRGDKEPSNQQRVAAMDAEIKSCEAKAKEKTDESKAKRAEAERLLTDAGIAHEPIHAFTFPNEANNPYTLGVVDMRPTEADKPVVADESKDAKAQAAELNASAAKDEREYLAIHMADITKGMTRHAQQMAGKVFSPEDNAAASAESKATARHMNYLGWQAFQKRALARKLLAAAVP